MNKFFEKLYLRRVFSRFHFIGIPPEPTMLKELLAMLSTTPTGRVILDNLIQMDPSQETKGLKKLLFRTPQSSLGKTILKEVFKNKIYLYFQHDPDFKSDGSFYPETNSIELFYEDIYDPNLSDKERLEAKISRTVALAHELQHAVMLYSIRKTALGRRSEKEALLADRILEAAAYFSDGKVKKELAQLYPQMKPNILSEKIQRYAHRKTFSYLQDEEVSPDISPQKVDKKIFFQTAYQGTNEQVEGSIRLERDAENKAKEEKKADTTNKMPAPKGTKKDFWDGVEEVLKEMHVDIPRHQLLKMTWRSTAYPSKRTKKIITKLRRSPER